MPESEQLVRSFFDEVWNKGRYQFMDENYSPDFSLHALWQNTALGRDGDADGTQCRSDDGDAAALWRRRAMRRPNIRLGQRIALEPWQQRNDQQCAHQRREDDGDGAANEPHIAVVHRTDPIIARI